MQNGRAATNSTQNPSTYTAVSFQFNRNSIFLVRPTLCRSLLRKFPVYRFLTGHVHINLETRPLKTSLVALPSFYTEPHQGPHRNLAWRNCLSTTSAKTWRSETECSALGFSYACRKPRNGQLAKMGSFHQSKQTDNKWYAAEVRWGILIENLTNILIP